jgi:hypothetical protein
LSIRTTTAFASCLLSLAALGCGDPAPVFPADYAATYVEVRDCRRSADHDLHYIRILAAPDAVATFQDRDQPFAPGAVVIKPEYVDEDCTELFTITAMRKEEAGADPEAGDWTWQKVTPELRVDTTADIARCIQCHALCGNPPDGHDGVCAH